MTSLEQSIFSFDIYELDLQIWDLAVAQTQFRKLRLVAANVAQVMDVDPVQW